MHIGIHTKKKAYAARGSFDEYILSTNLLPPKSIALGYDDHNCEKTIYKHSLWPSFCFQVIDTQCTFSMPKALFFSGSGAFFLCAPFGVLGNTNNLQVEESSIHRIKLFFLKTNERRHLSITSSTLTAGPSYKVVQNHYLSFLASEPRTSFAFSSFSKFAFCCRSCWISELSWAWRRFRVGLTCKNKQ